MQDTANPDTGKLQYTNENEDKTYVPNAMYIIDTCCKVNLNTAVLNNTDRLVITGGNSEEFTIDAKSITLPASGTKTSTVSYNYTAPSDGNPGTGWRITSSSSKALTFNFVGTSIFNNITNITTAELDQAYTFTVECYGLSGLTSINVGNGKYGVAGSNVTLKVANCNALTEIECAKSGAGGSGGTSNVTIDNCQSLTTLNCGNGDDSSGSIGGSGSTSNITISNCASLTTLNCGNGGTSDGNFGGNGGNNCTVTLTNCMIPLEFKYAVGGSGGSGNGVTNSFEATFNRCFIRIPEQAQDALDFDLDPQSGGSITTIGSFHITNASPITNSTHFQCKVETGVLNKLSNRAAMNSISRYLITNIGDVHSVTINTNKDTYSFQSETTNGEFHFCSIDGTTLTIQQNGYYVLGPVMFQNTTDKSIQIKL